MTEKNLFPFFIAKKMYASCLKLLTFTLILREYTKSSLLKSVIDLLLTKLHVISVPKGIRFNLIKSEFLDIKMNSTVIKQFRNVETLQLDTFYHCK